MIEVCISAVREKERELVSDLEKKKRQNTEIINSQVGKIFQQIWRTLSVYLGVLYQKIRGS